MRYYYEDPLAAAWMAKHFGMQFEGYDEIEIDMGEILSAALKPHDVRINYIVPSIFIIRLDSLHLLEPLEGDLCRIRLPIKYDGTDQHVTAYSAENKLPKSSEFVAIIQRNGIAFMWPKTEAEDGNG